jgi:hypothetical protein
MNASLRAENRTQDLLHTKEECCTFKSETSTTGASVTRLYLCVFICFCVSYFWLSEQKELKFTFCLLHVLYSLEGKSDYGLLIEIDVQGNCTELFYVSVLSVRCGETDSAKETRKYVSYEVTWKEHRKCVLK